MKKITLIMAVLLIFAGCSAVSVSTDYDPGADFAKYKTYMHGTANNPEDALMKNQLVLNRVYEAIDKSLQAKGYTKVESDPDFLVYPHGATKEKTDIQNLGYGYGGWWGGGPYSGGNIDVNQYTEATLFIDIVDKSANKMVWRGTGTGVINKPSSPEEGTKKANEAVNKILEDFPPQTKK